MSNDKTLCGEVMLAGDDWLCDLAKGHEYAHYCSAQDVAAAPAGLAEALAKADFCGASEMGLTCWRLKGHEGLHSSIPELTAPAAFRVVTAWEPAPIFDSTKLQDAYNGDQVIDPMSVEHDFTLTPDQPEAVFTVLDGPKGVIRYEGASEFVGRIVCRRDSIQIQRIGDEGVLIESVKVTIK